MSLRAGLPRGVALLPEHLLRTRLEPGYRPVHLPQFDIMPVDKTAGRYDGRVVIAAIHVDHADGSAVRSDDIGPIGRHLCLHGALLASLLAGKMNRRTYEFEEECRGMM